jgi:hypothetical protein
MTINAVPTMHTVIVMVVFSIVYLLIVLRRTLHGEFDLYDLIMLSMVAIVPLVFISFPGLAGYVSRVTGVVFPFIIMFATLFLVVFIFMHRVTARLHKLERQNCALLQEFSLLSLDLDQAQRGRPGA